MFSSPGIFNVLDKWYMGFPMIANDSSKAAQNTNVLQHIVWAAQNASMTGCNSGGALSLAATILFPGNDSVPLPVGSGTPNDCATYYLAIPSSGLSPDAAIVINCNWPLRFLGTGNVKLAMVDAGFGFGDMFWLNNGAGDNIGGITFEELRFHYPAVTETTGIPNNCAIHSAPPSGVQNCRIVRCVFEDCPIGIWFEDALQCSIRDCTLKYTNNAGIAIKLGSGANSGDTTAAKEIFITDCVLNGGKITHGGGAPYGSTALWIQASDHVRVTDVQIDSYQNGILIWPKYGGSAISAHLHRR